MCRMESSFISENFCWIIYFKILLYCFDFVFRSLHFCYLGLSLPIIYTFVLVQLSLALSASVHITFCLFSFLSICLVVGSPWDLLSFESHVFLVFLSEMILLSVSIFLNCASSCFIASFYGDHSLIFGCLSRSLSFLLQSSFIAMVFH